MILVLLIGAQITGLVYLVAEVTPSLVRGVGTSLLGATTGASIVWLYCHGKQR